MKQLLLLSTMVLLIVGCTTETATTNDLTNADTDNPSSSADGTTELSGSTGNANNTLTCPVSTCYYAGYDGNATDFSVLIPSFRNATSDLETDTTVAVLTTESVTLQTDTIDRLIEERRNTDPTFSDQQEERLRRMLGGNHLAYKIVPTGAGITYFEMRQPGPPSAFGFNTEKVGIIVNQYDSDQITAGLTRYNSGQGDTLAGCISCHASGVSGAPPHQLGRIMELSDEETLQWIETGSVLGRTASIIHTWTFSDAAQREGIVPYLRSLQVKDMEQFTTLIFEEAMTNGLNGNPPPTP